MSNESAKEQLRQTLLGLKEAKDAEPIRGGLRNDPTRQLAKALRELEERIEAIEKRLESIDSVVDLYRPLG